MRRRRRAAGLEPRTKVQGTPWILGLEALVRDEALADRKNVGGKAARLVWLRRHGFLVPETWVIPQKAFGAALRELSPACEPRSLLRAASGRAVYTRAAEARQEILSAKLPAHLEEELEALWAAQGANAPWGFAVRSSATCEDGALVSMAGLAESVLGVRGAPALADAVRRVWASIASGRALGYLATHGVRDVGMAVVLQPIVRASAAGVMFTRKHGGPRERIVNAGFGLGSPVVDGVTTPDMLRIREDGQVLESHDRAQAARSGRRRGGRRWRSPSSTPTRPRSRTSASPSSRPSRSASSRSRTSRGTSSSRAKASTCGSCRRVTSRAAAFPKVVTRPPCGAAATSARRCPASRRRSRGRSPATTASRASARRSARSAARCRSTRGSSATCTAAST